MKHDNKPISMAWIFWYIVWVSLFQVTTQAVEVAVGKSVREGERYTNRKSNGSYKILNKLVKPLISKRGAGSLVFPEDNLTPFYQKPIIPEDCKKIGICKEIPNYPRDLVAILLKELERRNMTFNKDIIEVPQIAQRIGPEDDTVELCNSNEQPYDPEGALDEHDVWHVIINDKVKPKQVFRVEICHNQDSPCSSVAHFQNGYKSRCVQKIIYRNMIALNNKSEVIEKPFKVPSCCKCVVSLN